jgi:hypothetical protein
MSATPEGTGSATGSRSAGAGAARHHPFWCATMTTAWSRRPGRLPGSRIPVALALIPQAGHRRAGSPLAETDTPSAARMAATEPQSRRPEEDGAGRSPSSPVMLEELQAGFARLSTLFDEAFCRCWSRLEPDRRHR